MVTLGGRDYMITVDSYHGFEMYVFGYNFANTCTTRGTLMMKLENGLERKKMIDV